MKTIYTPAKKKTILIVDDDQIVVQIYREKFRRKGFLVETADSGEDAMKSLIRFPVDLVILDLCLPGAKGVEVLNNIRSEFDTLPVIAFSNAYLGNLMRAALAAGANKCVAKAECTPAVMLDLVRELLGDIHSKIADTAPKIVADDAGGKPAVQLETESRQALAATLLGNAPQTLAKLRAGFQSLTRTGQEDLHSAELLEMRRWVHSLTGSAGLLGFKKIAQLAAALEALLIEVHAQPKKITPSVLRTLGQAIDVLASLVDEARNSQPEAVVAPRILVVDDELISRETICSALEKASLSAISLDDSLAAEHILKHDRFDLIFLDVEMPGRTGPELCANIRHMPTNRTTPIVFVTAHSDFETQAQSVLSGGNDFILKPFLLVELVVKAETWLFRANTEKLATPTQQSNSLTPADSHEAQGSTDHAALSAND
jgi:DNA-binding response OmpR family regulator